MTLRSKAALITSAVLVLGLGTNTAVLTYLAYSSYEQATVAQVTASGESLAADIEKVLALGLTLNDLAGFDEKMRAVVTKQPVVAYAMLTDASGALVQHTVSGAVLPVGSLLTTDFTKASSLVRKVGADFQVGTALRDDKNQVVGVMTLAASGAVLERKLWSLLASALLVGVVLCVVFIALVNMLIWRAVISRIADIERVAVRVAAGDLTRTAAVIGHDELASLAAAVNNMAASLRAMIGRIGNLVGGVQGVTKVVRDASSSTQTIVDVQRRAVEDTARAVSDLSDEIRSVAVSSNSLETSASAATTAVQTMGVAAGELVRNASSLFDNAGEAAASIQQMSTSLEQTAKGLSSVTRSAHETSEAVMGVNQLFAQIQARANESVRLAELVSGEAAERGLGSISGAMQGMTDIRTSVGALAETINRLESRSLQIGKILSVISSVAGETTLLALNASILASQAGGESGRAFGVIASEIKALAERTTASTKEIGDLVSAVQQDTRSSVTKVGDGLQAVEKGVTLFGNVRQALDSIRESAGVSTDMARAIQGAATEGSGSMNQMSVAAASISREIEHLSRATAEQSKGSEQIVQATEKMRVMSGDITKTTEAQSAGAQKLTLGSGNVSRQAGEINAAIVNQRARTADIVTTIARIRESTVELTTQATEMDKAVRDLAGDTKTLLAELERFEL